MFLCCLSCFNLDLIHCGHNKKHPYVIWNSDSYRGSSSLQPNTILLTSGKMFTCLHCCSTYGFFGLSIRLKTRRRQESRQTSGLSGTESQDSSKYLCFYCPFVSAFASDLGSVWIYVQGVNRHIHACACTHMHRRDSKKKKKKDCLEGFVLRR